MKFIIGNKLSGVNLGTYEAETQAEALDAMARDAGYANYADIGPAISGGDDLVITEVAEESESEEQSIAFRAGVRAKQRGEKLAESALKNLNPESTRYEDFIAGYDSIK